MKLFDMDNLDWTDQISINPEIRDIVEDLSTFTGLDIHICAKRLKTYSIEEMASSWRQANPQTDEEMRRFYECTGLYIWELTRWSLDRRRWVLWQTIENLAHEYPADKSYPVVLDYGAGVGYDALCLAKNGYKLILADVPGITQAFARHRFRRRGINADFVSINKDTTNFGRSYDLAICLDVIEHVADPIGTLEMICNGLRTGGILMINWPIETVEIHPCHLEGNVNLFISEDWRRAMNVCGLDEAGDLVYRKVGWLRRVMRRIRFLFWKTTGIWIRRPGGVAKCRQSAS